MKLLYPIQVKNSFIFNSTSRDFIVEEIPLYQFSGDGEHLILKVRKKDMSSWDMIAKISNYLGIKRRDVGYAGLKDKYAMTIQYISIPAKGNETKLENFTHKKIKILSTHRHSNKIRIGHLKGNHFKVRLKKVLGVERSKLESTLNWIEKYGVPNYFGTQRFGTDGNNWKEGRLIVEGKLKIRDKKIKKFLISSYQSYLFNSWLSKRMELSLLIQTFTEKEVEKLLKLPLNSLKGVKSQSHPFKLLHGDLMMHYPHGKVFELTSIEEESRRFEKLDISPTGLLAGKRVSEATQIAGNIEQNYNKTIGENGARRYAWIGVENIKRQYIEEKAHYELEFTLPKGAYATNIINILQG